MSTEKLTGDNFKKGFLMDEELMAGISESKDSPGVFTAYVVRHTTGETLGVQPYENLFEAIRTLNQIPREWAFQSVSRCGNGNCGAGGGCGKKGGGCGMKAATSEFIGNVEGIASNCDDGSCSS